MTEDDDFLKAMGGVKPLETEQRVVITKEKVSDQSSQIRRQSAEAHLIKPQDPLGDAEVPQLDPYAVLEYRRPGVQHGVYKQLRMGRYTIDARLDLHRMSIEQARRSVYQFVKDCMQHDIRCALITHGKGEGRSNPAVLKSHVAHWLPQVTEVLAFHSAQPQHGGLGACYILLKKSEKKRQDNLERHQRRKV